MLFSRIVARLRQGPYSKLFRYGLCRDLRFQIDTPKCKIPIKVRQATDSDILSLLSADGFTDRRETLEISWRRAFVNKGAKGCFVAVDQRNNKPCYIHWLLTFDHNEFIEKLGWFPPLKSHQAILENAYTPKQYRGMGIMSEAMALIAERASDVGAYEVLAFVDHRNVSSLKGCQRAGFLPYMLQNRYQIGYGAIAWNKFEELSANDRRRTLRF